MEYRGPRGAHGVRVGQDPIKIDSKVGPPCGISLEGEPINSSSKSFPLVITRLYKSFIGSLISRLDQ